MRTARLRSLFTAIIVALALGSMPIAAQEAEEYPLTEVQAPLSGFSRTDGTIVLDDASFCRFVLASSLGDQRLTYVGLLDKSKKQKRARAAAFVAALDEAAVGRCVAALTAYRSEATEGDTVPGWARRSPVVPDAVAGLLPADFVAQPLAQPDQIGSAARTSGMGDLVSAPFTVTGGPWLAELDATSCASWSGQLRDARDPERAFALEGTREYLYELDSGHYYWDVMASDCEWSVDLVPVVMGPPPTPTPEPQAVVPALFGQDWDRYYKAENPEFLTAAQARQAVLAAGLATGECREQDGERRDRVWQQEPVAGSLVDFGSTVDVWIASDCDVYVGDRVVE